MLLAKVFFSDPQVCLGAPQTCHDDNTLNRGPNTISPAVDVWSAGAIMSDTAAWAHGGEIARKNYDELRLGEVELRPGSDPVAYFHNEVVRLGAVDTFHRRILDNLPDYDREITKEIIHLIETTMLPALPESVHAQQPKTIKAHLKKILESAGTATNNFERNDEGDVGIDKETGFLTTYSAEETMSQATDDEEDEITPAPRGRLSHVSTSPSQLQVPLRRDATNISVRSGPQLSWNDARQYHNARKNGWPVDEAVTKTLQSLENSLRGRDFFFLIDTSSSMAVHKDDVRDALLIYAYIVKNLDPDGFEVSFTSENRIKKHTTSTSAVADFNKQTWTGFAFEDKFGTIIDKVLDRISERGSRLSFHSERRSPKKQTIFVFTNGLWRGLDYIKNRVRNVIQTVLDRNLGRTQVVIQFVSFGSDREGLDQLEELDTFGRREGV